MQTLEQLLKTPDLKTVFDRLMRGLKGVGWTRHAAGISVGDIDVDGTPASSADLLIVIIDEGGRGVGTFQYSLDGGTTFSTTQTIPIDGIYIDPITTCTIIFDDAGETLIGFQAGDTWRCTLTQPAFPITAWQPFSTPLTQIEIDAEALQALFSLLQGIGSGGYATTAVGTWLDLLGEQLFNDKRRQGIATVGLVNLVCSATAGVATLQPGDLIVGNVGGQKYTNTGIVTTAPSVELDGVEVQAQLTGSIYNVPNGSITSVISSQAGVSVSNPDPGTGTWITKGGTDRETDAQYAQRLLAKWPARGYGVPSPNYDTWAKTASDAVTKTTTQIDQTVAGQLNLYLAGSGGGVTPGVVAAVQAYVNPRMPQCVNVVAQSATTLVVNVTGTAYIFKGKEGTAMKAILAALALLQTNAPIAGTVYWGQFFDAVQQTAAGVRNATLVSPNPENDIILGPTQALSINVNITQVLV